MLLAFPWTAVAEAGAVSAGAAVAGAVVAPWSLMVACADCDAAGAAVPVAGCGGGFAIALGAEVGSVGGCAVAEGTTIGIVAQEPRR